MFNFIYLFLWLQIYSQDMDVSAFVFQKNQKVLTDLQEKFNTDQALVLSIVAPEISRYVIFKDYIETKSLELLYINKGYKYCNFSIGYFQMRPRFVEEIEEYIKVNDIKVSELNSIKINSWLPAKKQREIRIDRLRNFEWQMLYAYAFYFVAEHRFKSIKFRSKEEKIIFFANAYNYGFLKPIDQIWDKTLDCNFTYGKKYKGKQDNYGELSLFFYFFYNKYASELNKISSPKKEIYKDMKYIKQIIFFSILLIILLSMFVKNKVL